MFMEIKRGTNAKLRPTCSGLCTFNITIPHGEAIIYKSKSSDIQSVIIRKHGLTPQMS